MMLMISQGYEKAKPNAMPDAKAVAAMMKYNETLQKAGVLLALDGLHPPSAGARISFSAGKPKVTDGPFTRSQGSTRNAILNGSRPHDTIEPTRGSHAIVLIPFALELIS